MRLDKFTEHKDIFDILPFVSGYMFLGLYKRQVYFGPILVLFPLRKYICKEAMIPWDKWAGAVAVYAV